MREEVKKWLLELAGVEYDLRWFFEIEVQKRIYILFRAMCVINNSEEWCYTITMNEQRIELWLGDFCKNFEYFYDEHYGREEKSLIKLFKYIFENPFAHPGYKF